MPELSVVVPTYRGEASLPELLERLRGALAGIDYEVVVVNDASPDGTWPLLESLATSHPELVAVDLMSNRGQAMATMAGLAQARAPLVATMDDDLQQPPEDLPVLIEALESNPRWDAVIGRWGRDHSSLFRRFGSWLYGASDRLSHGTPKGFRHTSFRLLRRRLVDALLEHQTRTPVLGPLIVQLSAEVHNVDVQHDERRHGTSTMTLAETVSRLLTNVVHGTAFPLRFISRLGIVTAVLAIGLAAYFFFRWLFGADTPLGWASVFVATTFFGGVILFAIGVLGEYTSVIVREVRRPPRWTVRSLLRSADGSPGGGPHRPDGDGLAGHEPGDDAGHRSGRDRDRDPGGRQAAEPGGEEGPA
jgi:glycosyltransferase involved in cell wall biosynthesis